MEVATTKIPIIPKLADMMVEIASSSMQDILIVQHHIHIGVAMVCAITKIRTIRKLEDTMVEIVSSSTTSILIAK